MLTLSALRVASLAQRYSLDAQQVGLVYLAVAAPGFVFIPVVVSSSTPSKGHHRCGVGLTLIYVAPPRAFSSTGSARESAPVHARVPSSSGLVFSASTSSLMRRSWPYLSA